MRAAGTLAKDGTEGVTGAGTPTAHRGSSPAAQALAGTLDGLFTMMARHRDTTVAVQEEGRSITYGAAEKRATQLATALLRADVQLGDPVLVHCTDHVQFLVAQLAVLKLGAVCVPVPRDARRATLERCAEVSGASLVLCSTALRARWDLPALVLDDPQVWSRISPWRPEASLPHSGRTDAAHLLVEDAGGTGHLVDHRAWMFSLADRNRRAGRPDRGVVVCQEPGAAQALSGAWWAFSAGATLCSRRFGSGAVPTPAAAGATPAAFRPMDHATTAVLRPADYATTAVLRPADYATTAVLRPADYASALDGAVPGAPTRLRTVLLVGEPCPNDLVLRHFEVMPRTRLLAEWAPLDGAMPWAAVDCSAHGVTSPSSFVVGDAVSRVRITIRDAKGRTLEDGRTGAIWASGTALPFDRLHTRSRPGGDVPATGSLAESNYLGRWNKAGALEITGRVTHPSPSPR
ncbi:AMP-binding protein [Streptomyces sp. NPDC058914]|uniref:AMP-binding protein n=1 Tax=Streptomyces TaxID=1883 RepID=UPI0036A60689